MCRYKDVENLDGEVCEGHIHLGVMMPPKLSISSFMGIFERKSTLMIDQLIVSKTLYWKEKGMNVIWSTWEELPQVLMGL